MFVNVKSEIGVVISFKLMVFHFSFKVHFFNSFFHKQLDAKGYDGVKRWTKKVRTLMHSWEGGSEGERGRVGEGGRE